MEADKAKLTLEVAQSKFCGAGVVSAYLLKHIAASAGSYAPGIQDRMFFDLQRRGGDLPGVQRWLAENLDQLNYQGYSYAARDITQPSADLLKWVSAGNGFRGAILPAAPAVLHPGLGVDDPTYTVALCGGDGKVMMIDPWPGTKPQQVPPPSTLDAAHRKRNYRAVALFWRGHS